MAAERSPTEIHELPMKCLVDLLWKEEVRRRPEMRVLARYMPVVPNETLPVRRARIAKTLVKSSAKPSRVGRERIKQMK